MDPQTVAKARATVIERAISIEALLDGIISQEYLGKVTNRFLSEVLYDEYFSFGLKVKIFAKITSDQMWVQKLNRLYTIRSYFAHRGTLTIDLEQPDDPLVPDPKKPANPINFGKVLLEFKKLADALEAVLLDHFVRAGGRLVDEEATGRKMIYIDVR